MKHRPFGAVCYEQRRLGLPTVHCRRQERKQSVSRQGCPKMRGTSAEDDGSLEEVSWARLEVREGFQEEVASES